MSEEEQRMLMEALISEIQIYDERQANGQWLKSITFRLPIIDGEMKMPVGNGLDTDNHVETVCMLLNQNVKAKYHVNVGIDAEEYYQMKKSR